MPVLALAVLWIALGYRIALARRDRSIWRMSFAASLLAVTTGGTLHLWADAHYGRDSLTIHRYFSVTCMALAGCWVQVFVESLRNQTPRRNRMIGHLVMGFCVALVNLVCWFAARIQHRLTMFPAPTPVRVLYTVSYGVVAMALVAVVQFCWVEVRRHAFSFSHSLPLVLIGMACLLAAVYVATFTAQLLIDGTPDQAANASSALVYPALALLGLGVMGLVVNPALDRAIGSITTYRALHPLWRDLTQGRPQMRLSAPWQPNGIAYLEERTGRLVTEIHDALRGRLVDAPPGAGPGALAEALRSGLDGPVSAAAILQPAQTTEEDRRQLIELARLYQQSGKPS